MLLALLVLALLVLALLGLWGFPQGSNPGESLRPGKPCIACRCPFLASCQRRMWVWVWVWERGAGHLVMVMVRAVFWERACLKSCSPCF